MVEALVWSDAVTNIHQAAAHFCGLDCAVKGVCARVCVCVRVHVCVCVHVVCVCVVCVCVCVHVRVCVIMWLNRSVPVSALLRIQDAYSRILNPVGLGVGTPLHRWLSLFTAGSALSIRWSPLSLPSSFSFPVSPSSHGASLRNQGSQVKASNKQVLVDSP